uniref:ATP synthase F0 subunit 8 n=1 Tax=Pyramidella dolabrata TaxID=252582 RepID=B3DFG4_9GAST|nr:ATP synthase F0 subunit 8 [Pyramidella dolabrata]ACE62851.1 ATP synthase F0 subunit 8 [Pyramidella dolabrata]
MPQLSPTLGLLVFTVLCSSFFLFFLLMNKNSSKAISLPEPTKSVKGGSSFLGKA